MQRRAYACERSIQGMEEKRSDNDDHGEKTEVGGSDLEPSRTAALRKGTGTKVVFSGLKTRIGDFEIIKELGKGAMGVVYEATQLSLSRRVALKILHGQRCIDQYFLRRFKREAKSAARINHPNVVHVYLIGEEDGVHFFAMEFVEGQTLYQRIIDKERLPIKEAVGFVIEAAQALQVALDNKVIHRDVKPENILVTKSGQIKVADLGLAKQIEDAGSMLTADSSAMGTPGYIAPEQAVDARHVDFRADIYSLGITLFHMVTGTLPFKGESSYAVMEQHRYTPLPKGAEVGCPLPLEVDELLARMCAKDPDQRPVSYAELIDDLGRILGIEDIEDPFRTPVEVIPSECQDTLPPSDVAKWPLLVKKWWPVGVAILAAVLLPLMSGFNNETDKGTEANGGGAGGAKQTNRPSTEKSSQPGQRAVLPANLEAVESESDRHGNLVRKGDDAETRMPLEIRESRTGMHLCYVRPGGL